MQRRPIPGDRRLWRVCLADQSGPLVAGVQRIVLATRMEMLQGLGPEQQRRLSEELQAVKANLARALSFDQTASGAQRPAGD